MLIHILRIIQRSCQPPLQHLIAKLALRRELHAHGLQQPQDALAVVDLALLFLATQLVLRADELRPVEAFGAVGGVVVFAEVEGGPRGGLFGGFDDAAGDGEGLSLVFLRSRVSVRT